ncbi:MAG: hypothetical protein ACVCEJ_00505 [Candidatus Izemoplasmataceae bacterium]
MRKIAAEIKTRLNSIDFSELWPSFHEFPFALYDDDKALINDKEITKPKQFYGNTAITYEGQVYAIWYVDDDTFKIDLDILTSKIVHEMFHAFQQEQGERRFPNELKGLDYSYDCVNLSMKYLESVKIEKLCKNFSEKNFNELLVNMNYRKENYSTAFQYESKIETVEGMAQFVELMTLKQLDIEHYRKKIFKMIEYIKTINHYGKIRFLSYDFGTLLMLIIKENGLPFDYDLTCEKTIADQLLESPFNGSGKPYCKQEFKELIQDIYATRKNIVMTILDNPHDTKILQHTLYGVDPLNTFAYDQYIYCKDFAAIKDDQLTWLRGEMLFETDKDGQLIKLYSKKSAI